MKLKYLSETRYNELYDGISENIDFYRNASDNTWITTFFNDRPYFKESRIDVNLPKLVCKVNDEEYINTIAIHSAFKDKITPQQASNPYLWTYLSHCEYWEYTSSRWANESMSIETIQKRFFCNTIDGNRIGFLRNSISRLWWFGYLTYQDNPSHSNPYELTKLMLSNSDLCQSIMERNFSMNKEICMGILSAIKIINDDPTLKNVGSVDNGDKYEWRALCKYINRYGGVALLDALTRDDIKQLSYDFIMKYRKKNNI